MCDFKPGDEVVCVDASDVGERLQEGRTYTVAGVGLCQSPSPTIQGTVSVYIVEAPNPSRLVSCDIGYWPSRFRKVQRRDLSTWLETAAADTDHLDSPIKTPARPKVDALLKRVQSGAFG